MTVTATASSFRHIVEERASCRGFRPDEVPRDVIQEMLTIAQRAPSWCNTQPWEIIVTVGSETERFRRALLAHIESDAGSGPPQSDFPRPEGYSGVRLDRRRACGWALYESMGVTRGDRAASAVEARKNFELFGAPHVAILTSPVELGVYGAVDCGVYLGTLLYAAQSIGLGAIAQAALAKHSPFLREYFEIPVDRNVLVGVSFGYRDESHPANNFRTQRAELAETVHWVADSR